MNKPSCINKGPYLCNNERCRTCGHLLVISAPSAMMCNYILDAGHSRGCDVDGCNKYVRSHEKRTFPKLPIKRFAVVDKDVANSLKQARIDQKIPRVKMSVKTGISDATYKRYEDGEIGIPTDRAVKMADALGLDEIRDFYKEQTKEGL